MQTPDEFFTALDKEIMSSAAVGNPFFSAFREGRVDVEGIRFFADQYFLYIRTFPQILAGLAHRVEDEVIRRELAKTIVSELGGSAGEVHFELFRKATAPLGVDPAPVGAVDYLPESVALVDGIKDLFYNDTVEAALGGHYTIEQSGLPMISSFYEGFRVLPGSTYESMEYFYLHLLVEHDHVAWIRSAVSRALGDERTRADIHRGAMRIAGLLGDFWGALYSRLPATSRA